MIYSKEVEMMCPVAKGAKHEPAPIPEEGKWVHAKEVKDTIIACLDAHLSEATSDPKKYKGEEM